MRYAAGRLWEEAAYLAYYMHWSLAEILDLEHPVRARMIEEVGKIHEQIAAMEPGEQMTWGGM
ncbi:MAG: hypothetical protein JO345_06255 [Streptosporangiaceae bacterium]|nr:hypothetical protein [Streptosporangiaceae bacterium]